MFDWDQDWAGESIWGEFTENKDHTVPHPRDGEHDIFLNYGYYSKKQRTEENIKQTSSNKNYVPRCVVGSISGHNTNEDLSAPGIDMDSWPDLPSINAEHEKHYDDDNAQDSLQTVLMNDFPEASDLGKEPGQLEGENESFHNEHLEMGGNNSFDCDWADIGGFDDLEKFLRSNDSIFVPDIGGSADEFLSSSANVICSTQQSIHTSDIPMTTFQPYNHEGFQYNFSENSDDTRKTEEMLDRQFKLSKSWKKVEERSNKNSLQNINDGVLSDSITQNEQFLMPIMPSSPSTSVRTCQFPSIAQQRRVGDSEHFGCLRLSPQFMLSGYAYPAYTFPETPVLSNPPAENNQTTQVVAGQNSNADLSVHSNNLNKPQDSLKKLTMTPQEKIEKLRRRQQMRAMLAIQEQQQQFGERTRSSDSLILQACSQKNQNWDASTGTSGAEEGAIKFPSSEMSLLLELDECTRIFTSDDDQALEATIYYQLQDALKRLDARVRLCIRDSLFRLANSATERQSASDRISTNETNRDEHPVNMKLNDQDRFARFSEAETKTNPIDRLVAHLLFHRPSEFKTLKEELLSSALLCPASVNTPGSTSGQSENVQGMGVQPKI